MKRRSLPWTLGSINKTVQAFVEPEVQRELPLELAKSSHNSTARRWCWMMMSRTFDDSIESAVEFGYYTLPGGTHSQESRLDTRNVYRGQVVVVVVEEEEMMLQLRRMMVHFAGRDCHLAAFLEAVKVSAVHVKQCYSLLFCHRSQGLVQHKPFLQIPDHEKSQIRIL